MGAPSGFLSWLLSPLIDRRVAAFQNDLLEKHIAEVENIYKQMRGWRHDYHNHIQAVKAHLRLGQYEEIEGYLDRLDEDLTSVDTVVKTGNVTMDAILNSKLSLARSKDIALNVKAFVPEAIPFSEIDLCVVVGNLLDNASEACLRIQEPSQRFIRVYIDAIKEHFYISVSNSTDGAIRKNTYLTSKNRPGHGFGLSRVDRIAAKYGGYVNRQNEEGAFATEVMLPFVRQKK